MACILISRFYLNGMACHLSGDFLLNLVSCFIRTVDSVDCCPFKGVIGVIIRHPSIKHSQPLQEPWQRSVRYLKSFMLLLFRENDGVKFRFIDGRVWYLTRSGWLRWPCWSLSAASVVSQSGAPLLYHWRSVPWHRWSCLRYPSSPSLFLFIFHLYVLCVPKPDTSPLIFSGFVTSFFIYNILFRNLHLISLFYNLFVPYNFRDISLHNIKIHHPEKGWNKNPCYRTGKAGSDIAAFPAAIIAVIPLPASSAAPAIIGSSPLSIPWIPFLRYIYKIKRDKNSCNAFHKVSTIGSTSAILSK